MGARTPSACVRGHRDTAPDSDTGDTLGQRRNGVCQVNGSVAVPVVAKGDCVTTLSMLDAMSLVGIVFSGLSALVIEDVGDEGGMVVVRARTGSEAVACPGCGAKTARVHGYHQRTAADVPVDAAG